MSRGGYDTRKETFFSMNKNSNILPTDVTKGKKEGHVCCSQHDQETKLGNSSTVRPQGSTRTIVVTKINKNVTASGNLPYGPQGKGDTYY